MVKAQEWLDKNYPKNGICQKKKNGWMGDNEGYGKRREEVKHLDISYESLEGSLKLEGFTSLETFERGDDNQLTRLDISPAKNLKSVYCADRSGDNFSEKKDKKITELIVGNLPKLEVLICQGNELINLDLRGCPNLQVLDCSENRKYWVDGEFKTGLTGLDLSNCPKLKDLNCKTNKLVDLNILGCSQLEKLNCSSNRLTNLENLDLSNKKQLKYLNIFLNKFFGNITVFSHLVSLEQLDIGNNDFFGSLEVLKNLDKLWSLDIGSTNIDRGLEYLPKGLKRIGCQGMEEHMRKLGNYNSEYGVGVKKIEEIMKPYYKAYGSDYFAADFSAWQKDNIDLINKTKQTEIQLETSSKKSKSAKRKEKLSTAQEQIANLQNELENTQKQLESLQIKYSFYENFFDNYFQNKKNELIELKSKLNKEEQEWLNVYCEASQETEKSSFVKKQLKRAKDNLKEKFSEKELELILEKQKEIEELENRLNNLQIQEEFSTQIQTLPK